MVMAVCLILFVPRSIMLNYEYALEPMERKHSTKIKKQQTHAMVMAIGMAMVITMTMAGFSSIICRITFNMSEKENKAHGHALCVLLVAHVSCACFF